MMGKLGDHSESWGENIERSKLDNKMKYEKCLPIIDHQYEENIHIHDMNSLATVALEPCLVRDELAGVPVFAPSLYSPNHGILPASLIFSASPGLPSRSTHQDLSCFATRDAYDLCRSSTFSPREATKP